MSDSGNINASEVEDWFDQEADESTLAPSVTPLSAAEKYVTSQLRVVRETKDYQLDYLKHALEPGRELIDISPAYQRRLRWANKKKSLLIESFLLNIPVPPIFLFEQDYNAYEVIDGRQRLDAVSTFLSNEYALTGLEYWPELNRKRFNDLPQILQKGLLRRSLPAVVLLAETRSAGEGEIDVRRVLFDRLNTGGIRLNPQELRNALYPGRLNALLISLAREDSFTSAWGIPSRMEGEEAEPPEELLGNALFASMADAELVLRFFALRDAVLSGKVGSLRRVLDRYMEENTNPKDQAIEQMRRQFIDCLSRLLNLFDGQPFILPVTRRPSRPLYDALMIALSLDESIDLGAHEEVIQQAVSEALQDDDKYDILVGRGNTIESVRERVSLASDLLNSR